MKKRNDHFNMDPWDSDYYETGSTEPPKTSGGMVALLLMSVIILCGISSALGLLKLQQNTTNLPADTQGQSPVSFRSDDADDPDVSIEPFGTGTTQPEQSAGLTLSDSPLSVENIPQEGGKSLQAIYEEVIDSVVSISCTMDSGSSTGTGVVISGEGYVVTNAHVVNGARSITVSLTDGRNLEAEMVGSDGATDLAVLHVDAEALIAAEFGDSSVLRVGDIVVAIGDPLGLELRGTMTDGIISAINRDITVDGRTMTLIQTNAALNAGNSGGPLLNCYGQVIGINTMKIGDYLSNSVEGLGFAIPSTTVKTIVDQLIDQGYVSGRPSIGISCQSVPGFYQRYYGLPAGLYVQEVEEGSAAAQVGIQSGDVLVSVDGTNVADTDSLTSLLYNYDAGDTVTLIIYRGRSYYSVELTLGENTK